MNTVEELATDLYAFIMGSPDYTWQDCPDRTKEKLRRQVQYIIEKSGAAAERDAALAKLAQVEALAEHWRYKGEFGWDAWQEGHGPDEEGFYLDRCSAELLKILEGPK